MSSALAVPLIFLGALVALFVAGALVYLAIFLPLAAARAKLLPYGGAKLLEGLSSVEEAVARGKATGLAGLELAAWAQAIAARRFEYSRRNPWDSPARCFERGLGYCIQQARALKLVYDGLGLESRLVQAFCCRFPAKVIHGVEAPGGVSGHAWLRVRVEGKDYDVCCGDAANSPGHFHFSPLSRVRALPPWAIPILHLLSVAENARRDAAASSRRPAR